jgi:hypothetical protein
LLSCGPLMSNLVAIGPAAKRLFIRHDSRTRMSREGKLHIVACCCNSKVLASLLPCLYSMTIPRLEDLLPHGRNRLARLLSTLPALRGRRPHRFADHRLRQSHHSRRRPLFFQLARPHHHDSRRHTRRTPCVAPLRRLFLVVTRNHCRCLLELLVVRKLPVHRHLHGRRPHVRITAGRLGGQRLDHSFHAMGPA